MVERKRIKQELNMTSKDEKDCTHPSLLFERLWTETERASLYLMSVKRRRNDFFLFG